MVQLPSLLVRSGLPHHERVQADGARRAQFGRVLLLQARNVITASLACGRHCLHRENRRRDEAGTLKRRTNPSPERASLEKSAHSSCTPHPRAHSPLPPAFRGGRAPHAAHSDEIPAGPRAQPTATATTKRGNKTGGCVGDALWLEEGGREAGGAPAREETGATCCIRRAPPRPRPAALLPGARRAQVQL